MNWRSMGVTFLRSPADEDVCRKVHPVITSIERDARITKGEVNEVRETLGWERIRVLIESGAIDAIGPKETAESFDMKEMVMSKRGF